jgi:RHS repeat-associated protein
VTITRNSEEQSSDPLGNPWMYTARFSDDETGLYYYRARAYSPATGRFLQRDPLGYAPAPSLYAYACSSPSTLRDPYGLYDENGEPENWKEAKDDVDEAEKEVKEAEAAVEEAEKYVEREEADEAAGRANFADAARDSLRRARSRLRAWRRFLCQDVKKYNRFVDQYNAAMSEPGGLKGRAPPGKIPEKPPEWDPEGSKEGRPGGSGSGDEGGGAPPAPPPEPDPPTEDTQRGQLLWDEIWRDAHRPGTDAWDDLAEILTFFPWGVLFGD